MYYANLSYKYYIRCILLNKKTVFKQAEEECWKYLKFADRK